MLAVVKEHLGPGFRSRRSPIPSCGTPTSSSRSAPWASAATDGPILAGTRPVPLSLTPGHEFSGDVVEVGKAVKNLKRGGPGHPRIVIGRGDCDMCIEGQGGPL